MESEEVKKGDGEIEQDAFAERRPSIVKLREMLKLVSQSPFLDQYKTIQSTSNSSGSQMDDSTNNQERIALVTNGGLEDHNTSQQNGGNDQVVWNPFHHSPQAYQNGVKRTFGKTNPFYSSFKDCSSKSVNTEDVSTQIFAEQSLCTIFVPPHEFQSPDMLAKHKMESPDTHTDLFQSLYIQASDHSQTSRHGQNPGMNEIDNLFRNLPDPFNGAPSKTEDPFEALHSNESDLFRGDLFQDFKGDVLKDESLLCPKEGNPFNCLSSMREVDLFQMVTKEEEPIGVPFSTSSDLFRSPTMTVSSQNVSSKTCDLFQDTSNETPDIFQPFASKTREDHSSPHAGNNSHSFNRTSNSTNSKAMYSTPLLNCCPPEMKSDVISPWSLENATDPFEETPVKFYPAVESNSSNVPGDIILTTPHGTKRGILKQPTPVSASRLLASSPSQTATEQTNEVIFKRPPKPLPRTRGPRSPMHKKPEIPAVPEPISSKISPADPPKTVLHMDSQPVKLENFAVFEDILLTGQERCVEDWPDDSPQLDPDFKPAGKFKLRRESMKIRKDSGGSGEDWDGSRISRKKKGRKFTVPLRPRRESKDTFADDVIECKYGTLPLTSKEKLELSDKYGDIMPPRGSKDDFSEKQIISGGDGEGEEKKIMDQKKKKGRKFTVPLLPRRGSKENREIEHTYGNVTLPRRSKDSFSQVFPGVEDEEQNRTGSKMKKPHKNKVKRTESTASYFQDNVQGKKYTNGHVFKGDVSEDMKGATGYTPQSLGKKSTKVKLLHLGRLKSKDDMVEGNSWHKTDMLSDEELDACKGSKDKGSVSVHCEAVTTHEGFLYHSSQLELSQHTSGHTPKGLFLEDDAPQKGADLFSPGTTYDDSPDDMDDYKLKKALKSKGFKKQDVKSNAMSSDYENPAGATSSDCFLSEAAQEAWLAAKMDERLAADLNEDEEEGDTDSLMEWWNIVEKWDEVTSDDEDLMIKEDETKSFTSLADKVHKGLRVFNKVFTERAEVLWQYIVSLHAFADNISQFHRKARIANITGNTTTAVGGVAAITGLALAPITLGASLIITAVGVGVATAGGITSASAAISDNVNNMHDRKKVEVVLQEYEAHLLDIGQILLFINQGLYRLRGHPFLRAGTQHYSEDWEVRRAVQMIGLVDRPTMRASEITDEAMASVQGLFQGMDQYFVKDSRELRKGCKKVVVAQIKEVATMLNDRLVELNAIREELQEASGSL